MKKIALIGSTGSVGTQVLKIAERYPEQFEIVALVADRPSETFFSQVEKFAPRLFALASQDKAGALAAAELAEADVVFNAAGGFAGLEYSLKAVGAGKTLALANKETLVCGGGLVLPVAARKGADVVPVDSEHSAVWQCLHFDRGARVRRIVLTASGGAFRGKTRAELAQVTPAQALAHPTWRMGAKITVDSATLMNKGYEVIEAHELFGVAYAHIEAVIQPQSVVHSLVELDDGALLAQLSYPTMELPIQLALTYPQRLPSSVAPLDFSRGFSLAFEPLRREEHPLYDLALSCGERGGVSPCVLNAADEEAVRAFLGGRISFLSIFTVVSETLQKIPSAPLEDFASLCEWDAAARRAARQIIEKLS